MSQYNKVMIFIDGSNIFHACRRQNLKLSYEKFMNILKKDRNVIRIFYYSGIKIPIKEEQNNFLKMLKHIDIEVITKPLKKRKVKCNKCGSIKITFLEKGIDASLSTDLLWYAIQNAYDIAILVSGDGDIIPPVDRIRLLGKKIELWAFKDSLSNDFRSLINKINLIDNIIDQIKE